MGEMDEIDAETKPTCVSYYAIATPLSMLFYILHSPLVAGGMLYLQAK